MKNTTTSLRRRARLAVLLGVLVLAGTVNLSARAAADTEPRLGVALTGSAELPGRLARGVAYEFELQLMNPGTAAATYVLTVDDTGDNAARWLSVVPRRVTLAPGERRTLGTRLAIPRTAKAGGHRLYLRAAVDAPSGGLRTTAAAVSRISFRVAS